jgi:hypothetical protein
MGWLFVRVSPLGLVRRLCHHANGFCARQPHHPPSVDVNPHLALVSLQFIRKSMWIEK